MQAGAGLDSFQTCGCAAQDSSCEQVEGARERAAPVCASVHVYGRTGIHAQSSKHGRGPDGANSGLGAGSVRKDRTCSERKACDDMIPRTLHQARAPVPLLTEAAGRYDTHCGMQAACGLCRHTYRVCMAAARRSQPCGVFSDARVLLCSYSCAIAHMRLTERDRMAGLAALSVDAASTTYLGPPSAATSLFFLGSAVWDSHPPQDQWVTSISRVHTLPPAAPTDGPCLPLRLMPHEAV
jgi:hypothetical protein